MENWASIPGWEGIYAASDLGLIKRLAGSPKCLSDRILKPMVNSRGYCTVGLTGPGRKQRPHVIHRLVLFAFIGEDESKPFANHINGIKTDNRLSNLEWVTHAENIKHAYDSNLHGKYAGEDASNSRLTEEQAIEIIQCLRDGKYRRDIANKFGVSCKTVAAIGSGETWKHLDRSNMEGKRTGSHKMTEDDVRNIKYELASGGNHCHIAKRYGVTSGAIWAISDGRTWKHV